MLNEERKTGYEDYHNEEEKRTIERVNEVYTIQRYGHNGRNTLERAREPLSDRGSITFNIDKANINKTKKKVKTRPSF